MLLDDLYLNSFLESVDRDDAKDGSEDLRLVSRHVGVHVGDDGRPNEVALRVLVNLHVATVQLK